MLVDECENCNGYGVLCLDCGETIDGCGCLIGILPEEQPDDIECPFCLGEGVLC